MTKRKLRMEEDIPEPAVRRSDSRHLAQAMRSLKCVDEETFRGWVVMGKGRVGTSVDAIFRTFCGDCMPEYAAEMAAEYKCREALLAAMDSE